MFSSFRLEQQRPLMLYCLKTQHVLVFSQIVQVQQQYKSAMLLVMLDHQHMAAHSMTGVILCPELQKRFSPFVQCLLDGMHAAQHAGDTPYVCKHIHHNSMRQLAAV
jgi:hypothetical protein